MKKVLSVLLAGALAMSTLAGCGNTQSSTPSSGGSAQSTGGDNAEKTTLVLWTRDRADASFIQPWIDKYNETNKDGIFIDYQMYTDNFEQALDMAYSTNSGPDLVGVSGMTDIFTSMSIRGSMSRSTSILPTNSAHGIRALFPMESMPLTASCITYLYSAAPAACSTTRAFLKNAESKSPRKPWRS